MRQCTASRTTRSTSPIPTHAYLSTSHPLQGLTLFVTKTGDPVYA